ETFGANAPRTRPRTAPPKGERSMKSTSGVARGQVPTPTCNRESHAPRRGCGCFIVPPDVLDRFAKDKKLSVDDRQTFAHTPAIEDHWRKARAAQTKLAQMAFSLLPATPMAVAAAPPAITVFDCQHGTALPGAPVSNPANATDATAKQAYTETKA